MVACTLCHLPNGNGHPESASISGLAAPYIIQQMPAFRDGERTNIRAPAMIEMALDISEPELRDAANYFAHIPRAQQQWIRVVETDMIPKVRIANGIYLRVGGDEREPIGDRIVETPEDVEATEVLRDDRSGFIAYVPEGSVTWK